MNSATLAAPFASTPLPGPTGPFVLAPGGDPARQAIQSRLYYTQYYKGRTDGLPDDERMTAAIKLVQIAARLQPPLVQPTGVYDRAVEQAIDRYRRTGSFDASAPPVTTTAPSPVAAAPPSRSLARDLVTFAVLTSPAWGLLLLMNRPWTRLGGGRSR